MFSIEHINYIKNKNKEKKIVILFQIGILILFCLIWELLADTNIINPFIFSSPSKCFSTLKNLIITNNLFMNIWVTVYETLISLLLGSFIGLLIATILWWNKIIAKILDPYLTILNSLPKVALGPIIIIWSGANIKSIIIMSLLISVIISIINMYEAFQQTDQLKIKLLKSFKATKLQIYFKLLLPSNISNIISILKINVSMSLIGVIMGELLVSKKGIGYLIMYGSQVFNLNLVITGILILCLVAALLYYIIYYIEKRLKN